MPRLYLIPSPIDEGGLDHLPEMNAKVIEGLTHFIAERSRTARRFIRLLLSEYDLQKAVFVEMNKHEPKRSKQDIIDLIQSRVDIGLLSEAGLPCIADPGAEVVNIARHAGYQIVPLSGPSSILLSLMASGLSGQYFTFHGYLPIKYPALKKELSKIEDSISKKGISHLFIETPYRNDQLIQTICKEISPQIRLCVARALTSSEEHIDTRKIAEWKDVKLGKVPALFILGR